MPTSWKMFSWIGLVALAGPLRADEPMRFPVTRDTWCSAVGAERDANLGGAARLKLKSYQELSLVDADLAPLLGRTVARATLHLRSLGEPRLDRVSVGGVAAEWVEGTSATYAPEAGASTFRRRRHPDEPWTPSGGDLADVILAAHGTTAWASRPATPPAAEGWQTVAVAPSVVAARVAGLSGGFVVFDDTGTEWTRAGDAFAVRPMPNRFVSSRDSNRASAPYFTIEAGPADALPPPAPVDLRAEPESADLPSGEAVVTWGTPVDPGPAGTLGFRVTVADRAVPLALVPLAPPTPGRVRLHLRDLGLAPGSTVAVAVRAVDAAGNVGPAATVPVVVSARTPRPLPPADPPPSPPAGARPLLWRGGPVAVLDELAQFDPATGTVVPPPRPGTNPLVASPIWDAATRRVTLHAARGEFVGFQVVLPRGLGAVDASLILPTAPRRAAVVHRLPPVATPRGPRPDPVVPGASRLGESLYFEVYVPPGAAPGLHQETLTLQAGVETLTLNVQLTVWDFDLPPTLGFVPELNCYDLPEDAERDYYRLAHLHRANLNRVPYSQRGVVAPGLAPKLGADGQLDWAAWDRRFGPLLDGSAFADLPRPGVPVAAFYLPLHENWPTPIEGHYNGGSWADESFTPEYRAAFVATSRRFAEHLDARGWRSTVFEGFLNNKRDFKGGARGWLGGSSPWLLDEPASWQDFAALRYFARAFHEGVAAARAGAPAGPVAKVAFRADISRPEWQRDGLDGFLDVNVVGGAVRDRLALVLDRKRAENQWVFEYGTANPVGESNVQPAAWCLDAWTLGLDGVIPWQTIGKPGSWAEGDELSLIYPPNPAVPGAEGGPVPSLRLKAFRRGQQDVEYLIRWAALTGEPRWAVAASARRALGLHARRSAPGGDAAGSVAYPDLRPDDLHALRHRIGRALSAAHAGPAPEPAAWTPTPRGP